jgi:uncharacterized protein (TIGR01777 family)
VLTRRPESAAGLPQGVRVVGWDGCTAQGWGELANGAEAIVNLAGATIAGAIPPLSRWTASAKRQILESRLNAGRAVVEAVQAAAEKPKVVIQQSAVGYYGSRGEAVLTEAAGPGSDWLSGVARQWEASTAPVEALGVRRAVTRTGLVLGEAGGIFQVIAIQFKLFAGGPMGNGRQWVSWITLADQVAAMRFLIESGAQGPFNLVAPNPVRYAEFARALGRALRRPSFIPVPAFALRLLMGQKADELLLTSQRVVPDCLLQHGFKFQYPEIEPALRHIVER